MYSGGTLYTHLTYTKLTLCDRCKKIPIFHLMWPQNASHSLQLLHNQPTVIYILAQAKMDCMGLNERQHSGNRAMYVIFYGKFTVPSSTVIFILSAT